LRRRCLYHAIDFPDVDREARILLARVPGIDAALALQIARLIERIRKEDLSKTPGIAETLDWAAALVGLGVSRLDADREAVFETLSCVVKTREDRARITREVTDRLIGKVA
jgi:MoxR-like ATPase